MKTKIFVIAFPVVFFFGLFFVVPAYSADAADAAEGIVNCGRTGQQACTICHLVEGVHRIVQFIVKLIIVTALTVMTIAGIMYIVSAGKPGMTELAKKAMINTLVGITIILVAHMSITVILNNIFKAKTDVLSAGGLTGMAGNTWSFTCDTTSLAGTGGIGGGSTTPPPTTPPPTTPPPTPPPTGGTQSETEARAALSERSNGKISVWESQEGATSISGLRQESVDGVVAFQKDFGGPITVTGAAETGGPHQSGAKSHANGYKVDIQATSSVNNYITNNYNRTGTRSDGAAAYSDGKGNTYYKEGSHWDVCYQCGAPS